MGWGRENRRAMLLDDSRCKRVAAIRWLAVFKRTTLGLTAREVTEHLHVSDTSQKRWLSTFKKTGDVFPPKRGAQGRPRALSKDEEFDLVTRVLDSPTTTLGKQHALIYLASGERVSLKTLCCVLHAHNLCRQRIQHLALRRDEDRARAWLSEMVTFFSADEILALDETAKDRRAYRSTIGWGLRGRAPTVRDEFRTRGGRVSALTIVSHRGFEDWRFNDGTFNADSFQVRETNPPSFHLL